MATEPKKTVKVKKGYSSKPKPSRTPLIAGIVALVAVAAGGWFWWQGRQAGESFEALVAQGRPGLEARVDTRPDYGRGHSAVGQSLQYSEDPPTSGTHWSNWTNPGFYTNPEPREKLVHALEHGNIVVYYDTPPQEVLDTLRAWTRRFSGQWDGMVMVPRQGLGQTVELTAWTRVLRKGDWDPALAAAFIDAYRGRGPENPVR